uniref:Uncharacterized protein n=1 Tax=Micrurus corallinus TaxID=54390 RepID=A0A2D4FEY8_MICCO
MSKLRRCPKHLNTGCSKDKSKQQLTLLTHPPPTCMHAVFINYNPFIIDCNQGSHLCKLQNTHFKPSNCQSYFKQSRFGLSSAGATNPRFHGPALIHGMPESGPRKQVKPHPRYAGNM